MREPALPDVLASGLNVVFCGSAAGETSARLRQYYARPGNRFWKILHEAGFTPRVLLPSEFTTVTQYGIGLTDLAKYAVGLDSQIADDEYDAVTLLAQLRDYQPRWCAFVGKKPAEMFFRGIGLLGIAFGSQPERVGETRLYVLPSTSGLNANWNALKHHWHAFGARVRAE